MKKIQKQNPCFALSDQCGNGSSPNWNDGVDNGIDTAAERISKCHTDCMCSCSIDVWLKKSQ